MKEQLTNIGNRAYYEDRAPNRGNISMAEGQGEIPKGGGGPPQPQPSFGEVAPSEERWLKEQGLELKRGRREALERGEVAVSGGQLGAPVDTSASFQEQADVLMARIQNPRLEAFLGRIRGGIPSNVQLVQNLHVELNGIYQQTAEQLLSRLAELRRQVPEPTQEIRALDQQYEQLRNEFDAINSLFMGEAEKVFLSEAAEAIRVPENIRRFLGRDLRREPLTEEERRLIKEDIDKIEVSLTNVHPAVLELIVQDEELSEKFLDALLSIPDSLPNLPYSQSIGFYGQINIEGLLRRVRVYDRSLIARGEMVPEQANIRQKKYSDQRGMRERFHEMRRYMLEGNVGNFAEIARTIAPEYLQSAVDNIGVGTVQRFYETGIKEILRDKQTIMPVDFIELDKRVQQRLRALAKTRAFRNQEYDRQLEEWEISRALAVGKNFAVIKLRVPELVSLGRISYETISQIYASFDYESVIRLVNPLRHLGARYSMGEPHGGQEYLKRVLRKIEEAVLTKEGPSKISKIFGLERATIERSTPLGQAGIDTGWRTMEAYLKDEIRVRVREEWIEDPVEKERYKILVYDESGTEQNVHAGRYLQMQARWKDSPEHKSKGDSFEMVDALRPLIEQTHFYRGLLIENSKVPYETKVELWKLVARDMPNQIMLILSEDENLREVKERHNIDFAELEKKLAVFEELRTLGQQRTLDLNAVIQLTDGGEIRLSEEEKAFLHELTDLVVNKKAEELAKIVWPYSPFYEDATLETADYLTVGAEAFRRRIGDAGAISEAGVALLETVRHPDMPWEKFVEHVDKAYNHLDVPHGFKTAQNIIYPFVAERFEFSKKYLWARLTPYLDDVLGFFGVPLSLAQQYYRRKGAAEDAYALWDKSEELVGKGIIRGRKESDEEVSQLEKLRKEIGATIWHIARERIPIGILLVLLVLALSLARSTVKEKV